MCITIECCDKHIVCLWQIGLAPLHAASKGGHCEIVQLLIENKAKINIQNHVSTCMLICLATCELCFKVIFMQDGVTPLFLAAYCGEVASVLLLCQNGAKVNLSNRV